MQGTWGPSQANQDARLECLTKINRVQIHQLSLVYVAEQDRILARVNTTAGEELRLWFTRRLVCQLWPMLDRVVAEQVASQAGASRMAGGDQHTRQMIAEFERANMLSDADFSTPYKPQSTKLPLGPEPLLITDVNIRPQPDGKLQLHLIEKLVDSAQPGGAPRSFNMLLNTQLSHGLTHLLRKAIDASKWPMGDAGAAAPAAGGDEPAPKPGPKYLN